MFNKTKTNQKNKSENNGFFRATTTILVALIIAFAWNISEANAQGNPPNPPPDCPDTPFEGPFQQIVHLENGCVITYWFWIRYACDMFFDTFIGEYRTSGPCDGINILDAIQKDIIGTDPDPWQTLLEKPPEKLFELPPCIYGSDMIGDFQWRFIRASCHATYETPEGETVVTPCQTDEYCAQQLVSCWRLGVNGEREIVNMVIRSGYWGDLSVPCGSIDIPGVGFFLCMPSCEQ